MSTLDGIEYQSLNGGDTPVLTRSHWAIFRNWDASTASRILELRTCIQFNRCQIQSVERNIPGGKYAGCIVRLRT
jgi:hypothetical protein